MNPTSSSVPHTHSTTGPEHPDKRALVLGGGGSTGNAWLIGILAGLFDAGLDVTAADLTIGTSAGSTAAIQIAGAPLAELLAATLAAPPARTGPAGSGSRGTPGRPVANHLERIGKIIASASDAADMRRRIGAAALELDAAADGTWQAQWRNTVAARLPGQNWPDREILITAVEAPSGQAAVFDRHSGVGLADAVAASCASTLPYRIGDRQYLDGGYRRNENADLAVGYGRVLVFSPFSGNTLHPLGWGMQLAAQASELRAGGSSVETVFPEPAAEQLFGSNAMDLSLRPAAAAAGYRQGGALAGPLAEFWH